MERLELLKEPFRTAYQNGDSIDYQTNPYSKIGDHSYVEKYGYHSEMHSDCSYSAPGLRGFSLSSYGNWGTVYTSELDDEGKEIFFNMIEENIIKPWRIRAYVKGDCFDYADGYGWKTYDKEKGWTICESPYVINCDSALQEEINKQMKAIADYDANPEILDSQIKFNPEEFDFNEKKISKELYNEEDSQYPEADDPEELLKQPLSNNLSDNTDKLIDLNDINSFYNLTKCECNEVKVGDKLKIYNSKTQTFDIVEVFSINRCYNPFTFEPVVAVTVNYDYDGAAEHDSHGLRKLSDPNVYYKVGSDEPIKQFTLKNEKQ